jgi:hypothetical protein
MYTSNFLDNSSLEKPKREATDLDFIIIEQENIEISYNKISPAKYKTSSTNVWPPSTNPPDQICRKRPLQC